MHNFAGKTLGKILGILGMTVHFGPGRSVIVRNFLAIMHKNSHMDLGNGEEDWRLGRARWMDDRPDA